MGWSEYDCRNRQTNVLDAVRYQLFKAMQNQSAVFEDVYLIKGKEKEDFAGDLYSCIHSLLC